MKFSYPLLKKLAPTTPSKAAAIELLTLHAFEAEDVGRQKIDVSLPPNRYADCASHRGIARELAAIQNTKVGFRDTRIVNPPRKGVVRVAVRTTACPRYAAYYFRLGRHPATPKWMKNVLAACGLRPINLIVDITNYVMLETGQPLHAFDANAIAKKSIIVRNAKAGERIISIEDKHYTLRKEDVVIADAEKLLALAGVKGGKGSEISGRTTEIILEAANFDPVATYDMSRRLQLVTDASARFSRGLSPELVDEGLSRATELLAELADAVLLDTADVYPKKQGKSVIEFRPETYEGLIGNAVSPKEATQLFTRLGCTVTSKGKTLRVQPPLRRLDLATPEDLIEEVARLRGYGAIPSRPPVVAIQPASIQEEVAFAASVRHSLATLGFDEVYTHSFVPGPDTPNAVEVENPISTQFAYLRPSLEQALHDAATENLKHATSARLFEIGTVFAMRDRRPEEHTSLGIIVSAPDVDPVREVRGSIEELFRRVGLVSFFFRNDGAALRVESDHAVIGMVTATDRGRHAVAELNLDSLFRLARGEQEYEPLPRFPAIQRDVSLLVTNNVRIGDIISTVQNTDLADIEDVDLLDLYRGERLGEGEQSVTLRIVFRASDRTLTDIEVDEEMRKIQDILGETYGAEIR